MARNRGKKALYEVMSKARVKPGPDRTVEQLHPNKSDEHIPEKDIKPVVEKTRTTTQWWNKPKIVQFNAGRIEFSLQYQIAVAIILGLVLLVIISYRLGQWSMAERQTTGPIERSENTIEGLENNSSVIKAGQDKRNQMQRTKQVTQNPPDQRTAVPAQSTGNNVIVLAQYGARADLVPVQDYFARFGIELDIVLENGRYFLQTKNTYDNPNNPGTDGYKMKQKITKIGAAYKNDAPEGYEKFAPHYFSDAYGKKIK